MAELMRNYIHKGTLQGLCERIKLVYPSFKSSPFLQATADQLGELGLFDRLDLITQALRKYLPEEFPQAAKILVQSLGSELDSLADDPTSKEYDSHRGFIVIALGNYIAEFGQDDFEISMDALLEMTKRFSSEGPIRQFLIHHEPKTLKKLKKWVKHPNVHVRRLVSEGSRPLLPWAPKLHAFVESPQKTISLLQGFYNDKHLYVRRSVANHLNDIAKDHPDLVVETLKSWQAKDEAQFLWMQKHALRTLIKQAHPEALELIGISSDVKVRLGSLQLSESSIKLGEKIHFELQLHSESKSHQEIMVDYIIHHRKANGTTSPKVFKWTQKTLPGTQGSGPSSLTLKKSHHIKEITTRKYYSGAHFVEIQVNGKILGRAEFELKV